MQGWTLSALTRQPTAHKAELAGVAALTVAAFVLRLVGIDQSLWGDEVFTYRIVTENGLWGTVRDVGHTTEVSPPFHYLLAWLAAQVGDPTVTIRLPSLILGTATVPLLYALGLRTVGPRAALVGSALVAIAPFAIYYGIQSRAYATLIFLSALSTLLLLRALRQGRSLPWLAYGVTAAAVLYTHYTGIFVVLGQFGWALWTHRAQVRQITLVHTAVALAYAPWLPSFLAQRDLGSRQQARFAERFPLSTERVARMVTDVLPGNSLGRATELVVWATIGAALVAVTVRAQRRRRQGGNAPRPALLLIVLLALVTPLGLVLYSVQPEKSLLLPAYLSASLPAFALLVGWLLSSLRPWFAIAAVGLVLAALVVAAAKTLDVDRQRPPYRQVARFLDDVVGPNDAVLTNEPGDLELYLRRKHRIVSADDAAAWNRAARGGHVFLVKLQVGFVGALPRLAGPNNRVPLRAEKRFPGSYPVSVGRYWGEVHARLGRRNGRLVMVWSLGPDISVAPGAALGFVDTVSVVGQRLEVRGWAADGAGRQAADWVLAFSGRRLLAVGRLGTPRPDVAKAYSKPTLLSGFELTARTTRPDKLPPRLRVLAGAGNQASELKLSEHARGLDLDPDGA